MVGSQVFQYAATHLHKLAMEDAATPAIVSVAAIDDFVCCLVYVPRGVTVAVTKDGQLLVKEQGSIKEETD